MSRIYDFTTRTNKHKEVNLFLDLYYIAFVPTLKLEWEKITWQMMMGLCDTSPKHI